MTTATEPDLTDGTATAGRPFLPKRRWEAADTVIALASGLIVVIFAIFAYLCWQGYAASIESAKTRAQTSANIAATQAAWLIGSGFTSLRLLDSKLAFEPAILDPAVKAELDAALTGLPSGASFAIYDNAGEVLDNGGSPSLPANIADRPYFAEVTSGPLVETVARQQADATTGTPLIVMARRLGDEVLAGVVVLAIPASALEGFWTGQAMQEGSTLTLVRDDGFIIARHPPLSETLNLAQTSQYWPEVVANENGTYDSGRSPADGVSRIVGYTHLRDYRVVAMGSVSKDSVLSGLWTAITTVLWLLVPFALALLGGSFLTARLLRQSAQTQRTLAAAVAHNEVLFREIHHRVKNNLQSVASLLQMQPIPREIKDNMGQRIAAMSAVHEHIYRSNDFETVRLSGYLATLIASLRAGHDPRVKVIEDLEDLPIDRDSATPLGLIVNEVVSNAFKHAFADGAPGEIAVRLRRVDDTHAQLLIEDNGNGFDPEAPAKGIGRRLITALTQQLGGVSHVESADGHGSRFMLEFPLTHPPAA